MLCLPIRLSLLCICCLLLAAEGRAADWPMWRYDAGRTAASPERLSGPLHPQWSHAFTPREQAWDDPLNLDLMTYDRVFEPIVMDGRMFLGFNDQDKLVALDAASGAILWTFYTGGPVRLAPVGWQGKVYFGSDDGFLYCVNADDGSLVWQFRGGPGPRKVIGNQRLISAWPVRGGPVIRDGEVYFTASIWPFMGVFIYALDAETGEVKWVNDGTGSQYIKQPHSAPSFAGVAPQGALVATRDILVVPGGRTVPAAFDRRTGDLLHFELNAGGKGTGGSWVCATDDEFFVHTRGKGTRAFDIRKGVKTAFMPNEPVLSELVYSAEMDKSKPVVRAYDAARKVAWEIAADGRGDLIRAGDQLLAAGSGRITAIALPVGDRAAGKQEPKIAWTLPVEGDVQRLLAADGRLFAVTLEGQVMAFGPQAVAQPDSEDKGERPLAVQPKTDGSDADQILLDQLLAAGPAEGYALWFGGENESLVSAMAARSPFVQLAVVDADVKRVASLRRQFDRAGLYGRVTVHPGGPHEFMAPPYVAHHVFVSDAVARRAIDDPSLLQTMYESVRPYGGVMQIITSSETASEIRQRLDGLELEQATVESVPRGLVIRRVGALPGSADWTHQHGDVANTIKSDDRRVKLPLGLLWFGGNSNTDVLPRHGHGPPEQVVGGRLFIQGMDSLSARDVYTGRVLWKRKFDDLGTYDVYYDATYKDAPLDTAYNQVHIPGANARGVNYVVTEDRIYIIEGDACHVLDPATGELLTKIQLPRDDPEGAKEWGYIGVYQDVLIGGVGFANYRQRHALDTTEDDKLAANRAGFGLKSFDRAGSAALVGFDRHSGEILWRIDALHSFWHNGVVAGGGRIYCLDKNPKPVEDQLRRRGQPNPDTYRIVAIDYRTGQPVWETRDNVFGTWLGYSLSRDLLLQAGASGSDRLSGEVGQGMTVYQAKDGQIKWQNKTLKYSGPCILHNDLIIANVNSYAVSAGAFSLLDGSQKMVTNPLTGQQQPWGLTRSYGCNKIIASENMLTFRSGAAGFYDMLTDGGTGNLGGFKSGCTSNLVVANGVLNAPDYTRTCACAYQNQTSLALVHMPDVEVWTVNYYLNSAAAKGNRVERLGINFGAPGHRTAGDGTPWTEFPAESGAAPPLAITVNGKPKYMRRHSAAFSHAELPWVHASAVEGMSEIRIAMTLKAPKDDAATDQASDDADRLVPDDAPKRAAADGPKVAAVPYRVRLMFSEPSSGQRDERVFDVVMQGETVLSDFRLGTPATVIQEFPAVLIADQLHIQFRAKQGLPILSGVELVRANDESRR